MIFTWKNLHIHSCGKRWTRRMLMSFKLLNVINIKWINAFHSFHMVCHVISHWDDGSGMTTILSFELTVASHQRMTVKKEYGSQARPDVYTWWPYSGRLTREGRNQTIGWDPKTEVGTPSRQRKWKRKESVVGQGSWQTEPKPVLRVEEDIKIFRIEEAIFFKPVLKIA